MARAMLRDDYAGYYPKAVAGVRLDDDAARHGKAVLQPTVDGTIPGSVTQPPSGVNPLVTVRERFAVGYDADGNPEWNWADVVKDVEAIKFEEREEVSDTSGLATVTGTLRILYPYSSPLIRETASVQTNDGRRWRVTGVKRFPDSLQFEIERIDSGS